MIWQSRQPYARTLDMLRSAIRAGENTIFAEIDQAAAAARIGLTLRPTTLLVFGNPKGGTPLMSAFPLLALELPLKLLIWEEPSGVKVAYAPLKEAATRYGVTGMGERIDAIDCAVEALIRGIE
jgi:uncharacterized protein (DUF302 family)